MNDEIVDLQQALCKKYGVAPFPAADDHKVGISQTVREGKLPINGMRIPPTADTTGWYIWAGEELSQDPDFFVPLHVAHLEDWCMDALPFLLLPPGWRFLVAGNHVDVWFDERLLAED